MQTVTVGNFDRPVPFRLARTSEKVRLSFRVGGQRVADERVLWTEVDGDRLFVKVANRWWPVKLDYVAPERAHRRFDEGPAWLI